ncbi:MAG: xanthine dehydrogenase family protein molybdopterin-binding subunit [Dehalococcoidia bacterium]|nr:MAG: xanthine dehydrogenase family protein molybdopterin-binding subunit [Dehalococcoidia bacterium]
MYEEYNIEDKGTGKDYPQSIYHNEAQLKVVGDPAILRVDAGAKVTGGFKFPDDQNWPNVLYIKFKRCPHSRATVTNIDTSAAKALPGVIMVLTHDDIPDMVASGPYNLTLMKECFQVGDEVAAVVAEEEDIAEEGVALIDVEYEVGDFILYAEDADKPGAVIVHGDTNEIGDPWTFTRGNPDTAFGQADHVLEGEYHSLVKPWFGARDHADIENESTTCFWENGTGTMNVWVSQQNPYGTTRTIAAALDLPYNRVRALPSGSGVGFGSKGGYQKVAQLAAYVSMKTNRPVKFRSDTEGNFNVTRKQADQHHQIKVGVNNDGSLVAIEQKARGNSGCFGGRCTNDATTSTQRIYNCPNAYLEGRDFYTNTPTTGAVRCVHHPHAVHFINCHMDKMAEIVDMDPADFLLKNVSTVSGFGTDPDNPEWDVGSNPNPALIQNVLTSSGWKSKWKGWGTPLAVNGTKQRGIGIAIHTCRHGYLANPESAMVKAYADGTFAAVVGSMDVGQGARTAMAIMAAEELGVSYDRVFPAHVDTGSAQESRSPGGSTVTRGSGTALILACRDLKEQLFKLAIDSGRIEASNPEDLEMADNKIYVKSDPSVNVEIQNVTSRMNSVSGPLIGRGSYASARDRWMHRQWGCVVAEVEVDVDTGEVQVLNIWNNHGAGRVIWYQGSMNQGYGANIMSMGRALFEGLIKDESTGITLNPNYLDYKLPTHADIPNITQIWEEEIDPFGPFGAKGIGEPLLGAPAPAIANAIYNACGARVDSTPITPEKILAALGKV